ncbi:MAG: LemA family protein [Chloroflexota bacterium]|nr:MAG: LemA family protein [Chloroflexota bacterium]
MSPQAVAAIFSFLLVFVVVGFLLVATYNSVITLAQQASKAWANIDVALKQRHDELPNLVEAVKGLMAFERETLTRVTQLRAAYSSAEPIPAQAATSEATSSAVRQLFAVVERYPDIKSQANVLELQREIQRLEEIIADRRELYNDTVFRYNTRIGQFPANTLTRLFSWAARPFFSAPEAQDTHGVLLTD